MLRIVLIVLLSCAACFITLWAVKTGGTVSFHGQGWDFQVSLWAFITSFLSGAGLLWIGAALLIWLIRSPMRVLLWLRHGKSKDKTADFLLDVEYLNCGLMEPVKKHMPYKNPLIQLYMELKVSVHDQKWDHAEKVIKKLQPHSLLESWGHMTLEKARGDHAMVVRYGLDVYRQGGPVDFTDLVLTAQACGRINAVQPYLEEAYDKNPSWILLRHLIPTWKEKGHIRKLRSHLKKIWNTHQTMDVFDEICSLDAVTHPLERVYVFKKLQYDIPLTADGYKTMHDVCLKADLKHDVEEARQYLLKHET